MLGECMTQPLVVSEIAVFYYWCNFDLNASSLQSTNGGTWRASPNMKSDPVEDISPFCLGKVIEVYTIYPDFHNYQIALHMIYRTFSSYQTRRIIFIQWSTWISTKINVQLRYRFATSTNKEAVTSLVIYFLIYYDSSNR